MSAKILAGIALLAMFEDVEIMRQIVQQSVEDAYQNLTAIHVMHDIPASRLLSPDGTDASGVYLPGYGVLIQTSAPLPLPEMAGKSKAGESWETSQWEVARRKLRGEPAGARANRDIAGAAHLPTREQLTSRMLEVLATNGHNFRELAGGDRVAIDIALPNGQSAHCAKCHSASEVFGSLAGGLPNTTGLEPTVYGLNFLIQQHQGAPITAEASGRLADENAGDLHMRQENYGEAIRAYMRVLSAAGAPCPPNAKQPIPPQLKLIYSKLAQALLAAGNYNEAEAITKELQRTRQSSGAGPSAGEREPASPAASLPAHLIISATKSQLDEVAAGKLSREAFAKAAQIEFFDPREAAREGESQKTTTTEESPSR